MASQCDVLNAVVQNLFTPLKVFRVVLAVTSALRTVLNGTVLRWDVLGLNDRSHILKQRDVCKKNTMVI